MPNHYTHWKPKKQKNNIWNNLRDVYDYNTLKEVFPWADTFRAGVVVVHQGANPEILLVYERYNIKNKQVKGPPKGMAELYESNALDTAIRELREETNITINSNDRLLPVQVIVPRAHLKEVLIYFIVLFRERPSISVCEKELTGYEWCPITNILNQAGDVSESTRRLLDVISTMNL